MQDNYFSFLDYRAAQRRLVAKFRRPRALLLHTVAFVVTMSAVWAYGLAWQLWFYPNNFIGPMLVGLVWSIVLAGHALLHYRRSAAVTERRELAVEGEMRQFIDQHGHEVDHDALFATHRRFEADLERQGRWSLSLTAFALVNVLSWVVATANMGTSWAFQMTAPLSIIVIGSVNVFLSWQQQRRLALANWFTRVPLRHIIGYGAGSLALYLAGVFRMMNHWDASNLTLVWGIVLILHIVWNVLLWPGVQSLRSDQASSTAAQPEKRKSGDQLVLADDGEVLDITDDHWDDDERTTRLQS